MAHIDSQSPCAAAMDATPGTTPYEQSSDAAPNKWANFSHFPLAGKTSNSQLPTQSIVTTTTQTQTQNSSECTPSPLRQNTSASSLRSSPSRLSIATTSPPPESPSRLSYSGLHSSLEMMPPLALNGNFVHSIPHTKEKDLPDGGNWVVQKYGGTSVGKFATGIADIIEASLKNNRVAVVCSARSSHTKLEGTTNRLLRAAKSAEIAGSKEFVPIVKTIEDDHIQAAKDTIRSPDILKQYVEDVQLECHSLVKILESAQHLEEVSHRAENKIISKGEKLACRYMAALLNDRGIPAQYVDLSDIIKTYNISTGRDGFYQQLAIALGQEILNCGSKVPIVTGYFGHVPGGLLHSIGRGYTDLCAALVAVGVHAAELQIWKEVDGIFTADPRKVPTARLIPSVTPSEAAELTFYGSEVIHPFTMEQVIRARIPIRIKNVMNPRGPGTVIIPEQQDNVFVADKSRPAIFRSRSSSILSVSPRIKRPTAVTIKHQIVVMNVHSNKRTRAHGFLASIFGILDKWHLSVDLIASSEVHVSMALHSEHTMISGGGVGGVGNVDDELTIQDERLQGAVNDLTELGNVDLANDMAIVSLVGKELKNLTGISGRFFSVLGDNNINIEMISQGASEINISCVIWARDADRALNVLHTSLFTFLD